MNINQSLNYFKKDRDWRKAYLKLAFLPLIALIPFVGSTIYSILVVSYLFMLTNRRIFKPDVVLLKWDMQIIMSIGGKFFGFSLLFGMFFGIFMIIVFALTSVATGITMQGQLDAQYMGTIFASIIFATLFMLYVDLALLVFVVDMKFASFFKFKAMKYILVDNFKEYAKLCLYKMGIGIVCTVSVITLIGPFLLFPIATFIVADMNAQFIREILKINKK